jgi:7-cyano-7-deazaguanine synthase in queuosine biosynthesis
MGQIILLSGGMDSLISYRLFYPYARPIFVRTGACYQEQDLHFAKMQAKNLTVAPLLPLMEWANGVVPHRNAILLSFVANAFHAHEIIVSAPRGELIWDQQPAFYRTMEKALKGVTILNPLQNLTKTQAVALWKKRGISTDLLLESRSCYGRKLRPCGQCPACVKRFIALKNNDIEEHYLFDPKAHAKKLVELANVRYLLKYGIRPAWEAWKAIYR